jgi:hypothetical protein
MSVEQALAQFKETEGGESFRLTRVPPEPGSGADPAGAAHAMAPARR